MGSGRGIGAGYARRSVIIVQATKFGMPMDDTGVKGGRLAPLYHAGSGRQPEPAAHRLDRPVQMHQTDPRHPIEESLRALDN